MKPFIAVHVETTGLCEGASPVLFDAVMFDRGGAELTSFTCLLKPYEHSIWEEGASQTHLITKQVADRFGYDYKAVNSSLNSWIATGTPVVSDQVATEISLGRMGINLDKSELFDTAQMVHVQRLRFEGDHERQFTCGVGPSLETLRLHVEPWVYFQQADQQIPHRNMARKIKEIFMRIINR